MQGSPPSRHHALTLEELEERRAAASAGSVDAVERVVASLQAQVVRAEATLGAVGNAEERAKTALVAKNARKCKLGNTCKHNHARTIQGVASLIASQGPA